MEPLGFDGRVAIITGGGSGIGEASARALANRGAKVLIVDLGCEVPGDGSDPDRGLAVAQSIRDDGGTAVAMWADIGSPGVAEEAVAKALNEFGRLDIVMSNAMIERLANFYDFTRQDVLDHLHVGLLGGWELCKAAWPHLAAQNYGRIVFTGSTALLGGSKGVPYALDKGGLVALSRSLNGIAKASKLDIKSNVIAPFGHTRMMLHPQYGSGPEHEAATEQIRTRLPASGVATTVTVLTHELCPTSGEIYGCSEGKVQRFFFSATRGIEGRDLTPEYLLENWQAIDDLEGSHELVGTSMDVATPFMARAMAVVGGEA